MQTNRLFHFVTALVIGLTSVEAVQAQQEKGIISGHVTDPGHLAVQGARVELQPKGPSRTVYRD